MAKVHVVTISIAWENERDDKSIMTEIGRDLEGMVRRSFDEFIAANTATVKALATSYDRKAEKQ